MYYPWRYKKVLRVHTLQSMYRKKGDVASSKLVPGRISNISPHHQMLCSPPKSTLLAAIVDQQLMTLLGLTYDLIKKYLLPSMASGKGHMVQRRKGLHSTRSNQKEILDAISYLVRLRGQKGIGKARGPDGRVRGLAQAKNEGVRYM